MKESVSVMFMDSILALDKLMLVVCKCCGAAVLSDYKKFHYDFHKMNGDEQRIR